MSILFWLTHTKDHITNASRLYADVLNRRHRGGPAHIVRGPTTVTSVRAKQLLDSAEKGKDICRLDLVYIAQCPDCKSLSNYMIHKWTINDQQIPYAFVKRELIKNNITVTTVNPRVPGTVSQWACICARQGSLEKEKNKLDIMFFHRRAFDRPIMLWQTQSRDLNTGQRRRSIIKLHVFLHKTNYFTKLCLYTK